jgi:chromosome segregation ATPase
MENNQNQNLRIYAIVMTILFALAAIGAFSFWRKSGGYFIQTQEQKASIDSLNAEKLRLETSLDQLQTSFDSLRVENEELEGKATASAELAQQKQAQIQQLRKQSANNLRDLQAQVASLQKAKAEYETIVAVLRAENNQLKAENEALKAENSELKGNNEQLSEQVGDLAKKLEEQIRKTQSASFKATSFRVEVGRKNDKMTTRAKRARELNISFDLADVPESYQGIQKLYLSITDENGKPIAAVNPQNVTVHGPTGDIPVIALQTRPVNLGATQRLNFNYKLEDRLAAGNYVAAIYCDRGLLGASSFRLSK